MYRFAKIPAMVAAGVAAGALTLAPATPAYAFNPTSSDQIHQLATHGTSDQPDGPWPGPTSDQPDGPWPGPTGDRTDGPWPGPTADLGR